MISIFHEIFRELGFVKSLKDFFPGLHRRLRKNQIAALWVAAHVDLIFSKAKLGWNSYRLTPAAVEDFCLRCRRHRESPFCYISCYIAKGDCKCVLLTGLSRARVRGATHTFETTKGARARMPAPHELHLFSGLPQHHRHFQLFLAAEDGYFHRVPSPVLVHDLGEDLLAIDFFSVNGDD